MDDDRKVVEVLTSS